MLKNVYAMKMPTFRLFELARATGEEKEME